MHADVLQKHLDSFREWRGRSFRGRGCCLLAAGQRLANEFVPLPALGFRRLARRLPGDLPTPFRAFPPLDKIISGAGIPDVAGADFLQGDETPAAFSLANLLDDANSFARCHTKLLGVCFSGITDTKIVTPASTSYIQ